jgi:hypothetical protein
MASLFFAVRYVPGFFYSMIDTETVVVPAVYRDLAVLHHPAADWQWGGFSALFPDVSTFFLLNFILRDGWLALQVLVVLFFIGWLAASAGLAAVLKRPHFRGEKHPLQPVLQTTFQQLSG